MSQTPYILNVKMWMKVLVILAYFASYCLCAFVLKMMFDWTKGF